MTVVAPDIAIPAANKSKLSIHEHEPLVWLVSILFTEEFWDRHGLTHGRFHFDDYQALLEMFDGSKSTRVTDAKFPNDDALFAAAKEFILNMPDAKACYEAAQQDIEAGILSYYVPQPDRWGEFPYYRVGDVDSYVFLNWAAHRGFPVSKQIVDAAHTVIYLVNSRKAAQEREAFFYPLITPGDFASLRKEPLWELDTGILYLIGRRNRKAPNATVYKGENDIFGRLLDYALDAHTAGQLKLIKTPTDMVTESLHLKVIPDELIAWAETLPLKLAMLDSTPSKPERPAHVTPDMALMYDAINHFWKGYDLANPNPSVAPMKKDVVAWLQEEAGKRGITDFSKTRAEIMDTIIRCPIARKGGNSL